MSSELRARIGGRRRVYLLRHGDVSYFDPAGKPHPHNGVPLNAGGAVQAEAAREALAGVPIDRAIDTGLLRTRQTAEIVLRGRNVPLESLPAFREISPGPLAPDAGAVEFQRHFVGALAIGITRESRFLGGETFGSLADRVLPAFREVIASPGWRHLLVVAHGGVNRVILLDALGAGIESMGRIEQEPACINVIDIESNEVMLVRQVNYTPYSPLKENIWATTMERIYLDHAAAITPAPGREEGP